MTLFLGNEKNKKNTAYRRMILASMAELSLWILRLTLPSLSPEAGSNARSAAGNRRCPPRVDDPHFKVHAARRGSSHPNCGHFLFIFRFRSPLRRSSRSLLYTVGCRSSFSPSSAGLPSRADSVTRYQPDFGLSVVFCIEPDTTRSPVVGSMYPYAFVT